MSYSGVITRSGLPPDYYLKNEKTGTIDKTAPPPAPLPEVKSASQIAVEKRLALLENTLKVIQSKPKQQRKRELDRKEPIDPSEKENRPPPQVRKRRRLTLTLKQTVKAAVDAKMTEFTYDGKQVDFSPINNATDRHEKYKIAHDIFKKANIKFTGNIAAILIGGNRQAYQRWFREHEGKNA